jgi:hypothetical protein
MNLPPDYLLLLSPFCRYAAGRAAIMITDLHAARAE